MNKQEKFYIGLNKYFKEPTYGINVTNPYGVHQYINDMYDKSEEDGGIDYKDLKNREKDNGSYSESAESFLKLFQLALDEYLNSQEEQEEEDDVDDKKNRKKKKWLTLILLLKIIYQIILIN